MVLDEPMSRRALAGSAVADQSPPADTGLFPYSLGAAWGGLPPAVRKLHDGGTSNARGEARIQGDGRWRARLARIIVGLPAPADGVALVLEIRAHAAGETWLRHFGQQAMRSELARSTRHAHALEERLGPARLTFGFEVVDARLHWIAREVRVLGIPLPLRWFRGMRASCGEEQGRYTFDIDVRLPLVGRLVAYSGWLEPVDDAG